MPTRTMRMKRGRAAIVAILMVISAVAMVFAAGMAVGAGLVHDTPEVTDTVLSYHAVSVIVAAVILPILGIWVVGVLGWAVWLGFVRQNSEEGEE